MTAAINQAAVTLATLIIQSEYAVRLTQLTPWACVPAGYRGAATLESHGFYYSFWFDFTGNKVLVRVEGLGIFLAEWEDEEPPVVATVPAAIVYQLPTPEALPQAA
ncbi:hypothetical protein [Hymenobacter cheonanensis]|uniref:hypothetical protein n=1 Tax=Hymenobacter sp. CA2-7 TaxID=3063993 RepID=UPI0027125D32|nr:hypothetical protein [Hymenobacter sp. CA2-7]MDO7885368.1 hypothetical protein [Hymenobacter sp. CA2-7]